MLYGLETSQESLELVDVFAKRGHDVIHGITGDISSKISNDGSRFWMKENDISDVDVCFLRSFGECTTEQLTRRISMLEHMEVAGVKVINSTYSFRRAQDHYSTQYTLQVAGLPIALTYTTENMTEAYHWSQEQCEILYKPILNETGKRPMRFKDPDLAYNAYKMLNRIYTPYILQKYVPNKGVFIKVLVIGDEAMGLSYEKYYGEDGEDENMEDHILLGETPKKYIDLGKKANNVMHLDYSSVDIVESDKGPVIIDVNGAPSWQGFKRIYDTDIAKKIITYVESKYNG